MSSFSQSGHKSEIMRMDTVFAGLEVAHVSKITRFTELRCHGLVSYL